MRCRAPLALAALAALAGACDRAPPAPAIHEAGARLPSDTRALLEHELALLHRESGVRFHLRSEAGPAAEAWHGADGLDAMTGDGRPDPRSVLLRYDEADLRAGLDLGYAIEPVVPDALAGFWLDEHLVPLLAQGRPGDALQLTVSMFSDRARHARLLEGLPLRGETLAARHAGGGGGARSLPPLPPDRATRSPGLPFPPEAPAASAEEAYERYLAWLAAGDPARRPAVLSAASRRLLADWPLTPGYMEHVYAREVGRPYQVLERGERALLYFLDDPILAPHFLEADDAGWRICLATEAAEVRNVAGGRYTWSLRRSAREALRPFAGDLVTIGATRRVRGGDNRPLPPPQG